MTKFCIFSTHDLDVLSPNYKNAQGNIAAKFEEATPYKICSRQNSETAPLPQAITITYACRDDEIFEYDGGLYKLVDQIYLIQYDLIFFLKFVVFKMYHSLNNYDFYKFLIVEL